MTDPGAQGALIYFRAQGFRHGSIPVAVPAVERVLQVHGWSVSSTDDLETFRQSLGQTRVVIFLLTSGDILDDSARARLKTFVEGGGGFVGVHSATVTELDWPWYLELAGAYFKGHPAGTPEGRVEVLDPAHPATRHLPQVFTRNEEWYSFDRQPTALAGTRVVLGVDEESYGPPSSLRMGTHPVAWHREVGQGRAFQTALGHSAESYVDPAFLEHVAGAVDWAGRRSHE